MYTPFYIGFNYQYGPFVHFGVLNPRQWSLAKQSSSKGWKVIPNNWNDWNDRIQTTLFIFFQKTLIHLWQSFFHGNDIDDVSEKNNVT